MGDDEDVLKAKLARTLNRMNMALDKARAAALAHDEAGCLKRIKEAYDLKVKVLVQMPDVLGQHFSNWYAGLETMDDVLARARRETEEWMTDWDEVESMLKRVQRVKHTLEDWVA
jgi:hypothetical protein